MANGGSTPPAGGTVMVAMLAGWIDAAGVAAAAMEALTHDGAATLIRSLDSDRYVDYRARRPTMELRAGVNVRLRWPTIDVVQGTDPGGRPFVGLIGPEPDMAWHAFCREVGDLAVELGVNRFVGLGAYPHGIPHTRAPQVVVTTPDPSLTIDNGPNAASLDIPAGATAALEHEMFDRGISAYGLWVQVPHYLSAMPFPSASLALLDMLHRMTGLTSPAVDLRQRALVQRERIDKLVAGNEEHQAMVRKLEVAYDEDNPKSPPTLEFRSGDQLAAEAEQFLRDLD